MVLYRTDRTKKRVEDGRVLKGNVGPVSWMTGSSQRKHGTRQLEDGVLSLTQKRLQSEEGL